MSRHSAYMESALRRYSHAADVRNSSGVVSSTESGIVFDSRPATVVNENCPNNVYAEPKVYAGGGDEAFLESQRKESLKATPYRYANGVLKVHVAVNTNAFSQENVNVSDAKQGPTTNATIHHNFGDALPDVPKNSFLECLDVDEKKMRAFFPHEPETRSTYAAQFRRAER